VWEAIETRAKEVRVVEAKEGRSQSRRRKKTRRKGEEKAKEKENSRNKESSGRVGNLG